MERPTSLRVDDALLARVDALAVALSERAAGASVSRANVLRIALERGVDVLEKEIGTRRSKK